MKKILILLCALCLPTGVLKASQPGKGDAAIGVTYGVLSHESDLEENEGIYGLEAEFFLPDGWSFGFAGFRPESESEFNGDFFLAYHPQRASWFFVEGIATYLNLPDDTGTAGLGFGVSFMPRNNMRLKFKATGRYVLGDLKLPESSDGGFSIATESCSNSNSNWCDEEPHPPPPGRDTRDVKALYGLQGAVSWVF